MGYTHYWDIFKKVPEDQWLNIRLDFFKVLPKFIEDLDHTTDQKLVVSDSEIYMNGVGEEAHETFVLSPKKSSEFCKTARKDYDLAVCCALIIAEHYMQKNIEVMSDGSDNDEWEDPRNLCQNILGYGMDFSLS